MTTDPKPASWSDDLTPADLGLVVPALSSRACARTRTGVTPGTAGALEAGLSDDLAWLGRNLMRPSSQPHSTLSSSGQACWTASGQAMLELALRAPRKAEKRWQLAGMRSKAFIAWLQDPFYP